jgi:ribosome-associated protein
MNSAIEFSLGGREFIELKNLLKVCGLCGTGGEAKIAIDHGDVVVDGKVETRKGCKIRTGQSVTFMKKEIKVF